MVLDIPSTGAEGACQIGFRDMEGPSRHVIKRAAGPCSLGKPVLHAEPWGRILILFGGLLLVLIGALAITDAGRRALVTFVWRGERREGAWRGGPFSGLSVPGLSDCRAHVGSGTSSVRLYLVSQRAA